ncbi:Chromatin accessibility complex protein 1 [Rhizoclosmatium sp. JEL0117]|nr:Chromatin accessibility complex protein 1 [Rhizoclosmatium sp. JEL0117]
MELSEEEYQQQLQLQAQQQQQQQQQQFAYYTVPVGMGYVPGANGVPMMVPMDAFGNPLVPLVPVLAQPHSQQPLLHNQQQLQQKRPSPKRAATAKKARANNDDDAGDKDNGGGGGLKAPKIPIPRVKAIMKEDEDVLMAGLDAATALGFAAERFLEYFATACLETAVKDHRKTVAYKDMAKTVREVSNLNFLEDLLPPMLTIKKAQEAKAALEKRAAADGEEPVDEDMNPQAEEGDAMNEDRNEAVAGDEQDQAEGEQQEEEEAEEEDGEGEGEAGDDYAE